MSRPKVKIIAMCTPTLGEVSIHWHSDVQRLMWPLNCGRAFFYTVGKPVAEARNECVFRAMEWNKQHDSREITHLFWVDDDVFVPEGALIALHNHRRDIASGVYFTRCEPGEALIFSGRGCGTVPFIPDQIMEVWGHGMGLTLITMAVYQRMLDEGLPKDQFGMPEWYKTENEYKLDPKIGMAWHGGTEDLYFLDKTDKLGYRPLVDCTSNCFGWHYCRKAKMGYPKKQFIAMTKGEPVIFDTPQGPRQWKE